VTHATIEEIAVAAGVAKGTVYLYFESKDDLLAAIREEHAAEMLRRADHAFAAAGEDFEGGIDALLQAIVDFQIEHAQLQDVICYAGHPSEVIVASEREVFRRFVEFVERGTEAGAFEVADAEATAALLYHP